MAAAPYVMMGVQMYLQKEEAKKSRKASQQATETSYQRWLKHAYPSAETVAAKKKSGLTTLAKAREEAEARIGSSLAARGFGPGSGAMPEAYGEVESGYLRALGEFETDITQWETTPYGAIPSAAYPTGQYYSSTAGLQQALGMMSAMQMSQSMYGSNPYLGYQPYGGTGSGSGAYPSTGYGGDYGGSWNAPGYDWGSNPAGGY